MSRTSWRDLNEISTISARSRQSRRVLCNLGEMEDISPRSCRELESNKHGEISARSLQSRRDLINLNEISPISARSRQSRRDPGKNFARVVLQNLITMHAGKVLCSSCAGKHGARYQTNFISLKAVLTFQTLMLATLGKLATTHDRVFILGNNCSWTLLPGST